ncbi:MAG: hypothetical protein ABI811_15350 [Acidobacteriota bacterium]
MSLEESGWIRPPRAPLGELFAGECRAGSPAPATHDLCNFGYARGTCSRFPAGGEGPDAVRFSVTHESASEVRLVYVIEKDHAPLAHGTLEYCINTGTLLGVEGFLREQATAFVASYLRR